MMGVDQSSGVGDADALLLGLGFKKVGLPGITPFSIARMILINPEMPAAGSERPMLLLIWIRRRKDLACSACYTHVRHDPRRWSEP